MTGVENYWATRHQSFDTDRDQCPEFQAVMCGIWQVKKGEPKGKHPVSPQELTQMAPLFTQEPFALAVHRGVGVHFDYVLGLP